MTNEEETRKVQALRDAFMQVADGETHKATLLAAIYAFVDTLGDKRIDLELYNILGPLFLRRASVATRAYARLRMSLPADALEKALKNWSNALSTDELTYTVNFEALDRTEELLLVELEPIYPGITERMHAQDFGQLISGEQT